MEDYQIGFVPHSTELNQRKYTIKTKKYVGWEKEFYIGDYIEIILSLSKYSLYLQRDGLLNKIWIVSNIFWWNEECD